jgi:hypothetical protein
MNWNEMDWTALDRLRAGFLSGEAGARDYWRSERDLASYDATFAQRIGWKWDFVLDELKNRGWTPPAGDWLDWGCGSGIAHRTCLNHFGAESVSRLHLWDRSTLALNFASKRAAQKHPNLPILQGLPERPSLVLLSHVLTELDPAAWEALKQKVLDGATAVVWVEPGNHATSRRLGEVREQLRAAFSVVAPCTHSAACGMFAPGNERHWCHQFASPPGAVFTDPNWGKFAHLAGIDLRSLPVSFLVLDRRGAPVLPEGATRVIGRPRVHKGYALCLGCHAPGLSDCRVSRRHLPEAYRQIQKGQVPSLQIWKRDGEEIVEMHSLAETPPSSEKDPG